MPKRRLKKSKIAKQHKPRQLPSISPSIPEIVPPVTVQQEIVAVEKWYHQWQKRLKIFELKVVTGAVMLLSLAIFSAIAVIAYDTYRLEKQKQALMQEREKISSQINYWQDVTKKYQGYRDGYFQLALLEYQLGEKEKATVYLQNVFDIDPNYEPGRKLEALLKK